MEDLLPLYGVSSHSLVASKFYIWAKSKFTYFFFCCLCNVSCCRTVARSKAKATGESYTVGVWRPLAIPRGRAFVLSLTSEQELGVGMEE